MKDRAKLRGEIIDILQDTDWSDQGIENMADKIIALRDDVGLSEQVKAFNEQMAIDHHWYYPVPEEDIDNYCKSL